MFKSQTSQLSQYHNAQVSDMSTFPISQCSSLRNLNCPNITMFKSQIGGLALNRRKLSEMVSEWSPGTENRPPDMPRPFPSLWDRSRGPKSGKKVNKLPVWVSRWGYFPSCRFRPQQSKEKSLASPLHCQQIRLPNRAVATCDPGSCAD